MPNNQEIFVRYRKYFLFYILLCLLIQIPVLWLKLPQEREGWLSDISYNWNRGLTGKMAKDIPWGGTWSMGRGRLFYLTHHIFYKIFGVGLFQGRMITFIAGALLLFLVFRWTAKNISYGAAMLSTILLMVSFSFWPFLPVVSQDMIHCLFFFASFCLTYLAVSSKRSRDYFAAGLVSALSIEVSHRGIEIVLCVYLAHLIFSGRKAFYRNSAWLLAGSCVAFLVWFSSSVLPMGIKNFIEHQVPAAGNSPVYAFNMLTNEIKRFLLYIRSMRDLAKIEILYWFILLVAFYKNHLKLKYPQATKFILCWILITFAVMSVISYLDPQISPVYMLLYSIFICILCGISLYELLQRGKKWAYGLLFLILCSGLGYQIGRVGVCSYHQYFKVGYGMEGYNERLRSNIDLSKNILGDVEYWYAFPDAQYYGGNFYLSRVINVLHELKLPNEYEDSRERAQAMLKVLKDRKIEYIVSSAHQGYSKDIISQYFPGCELPQKNFKLINKLEINFNWDHDAKAVPHYRIEIYKVASYEL